ncbi:MAG TPA: peroxiredoxin-like family protein [Burkholderiales bacterium]|jgi:peroxiredoxin|nr:peroxiredoxin-like family protein [Burkholderiales bacterium]
MSLTEELATQKQTAAARFAPERLATMEAATAQLRASGIEGTALKAGERAPDATLTNVQGKQVRLADELAKGPAIVVFYRGGWCPYCNLTLRAYQKLLPQIRALGAGMIAVTPETPDRSLSTSEKNALEYPVLSDPELRAAAAFGLAFELPPELQALYLKNGNDLRLINGGGQWSLPVPATYAIGADGLVLYAHVDADYRNRAEPTDALAALQRVAA